MRRTDAVRQKDKMKMGATDRTRNVASGGDRPSGGRRHTTRTRRYIRYHASRSVETHKKLIFEAGMLIWSPWRFGLSTYQYKNWKTRPSGCISGDRYTVNALRILFFELTPATTTYMFVRIGSRLILICSNWLCHKNIATHRHAASKQSYHKISR